MWDFLNLLNLLVGLACALLGFIVYVYLFNKDLVSEQNLDNLSLLAMHNPYEFPVLADVDYIVTSSDTLLDAVVTDIRLAVKKWKRTIPKTIKFVKIDKKETLVERKIKELEAIVGEFKGIRLFDDKIQRAIKLYYMQKLQTQETDRCIKEVKDKIMEDLLACGRMKHFIAIFGDSEGARIHKLYLMDYEGESLLWHIVNIARQIEENCIPESPQNIQIQAFLKYKAILTNLVNLLISSKIRICVITDKTDYASFQREITTTIREKTSIIGYLLIKECDSFNRCNGFLHFLNNKVSYYWAFDECEFLMPYGDSHDIPKSCSEDHDFFYLVNHTESLHRKIEAIHGRPEHRKKSKYK